MFPEHSKSPQFPALDAPPAPLPAAHGVCLPLLTKAQPFPHPAPSPRRSYTLCSIVTTLIAIASWECILMKTLSHLRLINDMTNR